MTSGSIISIGGMMIGLLNVIVKLPVGDKSYTDALRGSCSNATGLDAVEPRTLYFER